MLEEVLYPGLPTANWQMLNSERMALMGLLAQVRPKNVLEVGVYHGGSLSLIAKFAQHVWACDIDPEVPGRFAVPKNVDLRIGAPETVLTDLLSELDAKSIGLDLVLIDADHSAAGVRRDIERIIHRRFLPAGPMFIVMHDSGNPECRRGMASADWASCPYVHAVELDFVPGQIRGGEVWGGLGLAYLNSSPRHGELSISAGAADTVRALHGATAGGQPH
ncbi:class I SAM-dependent methyltransferase [Variovorax sp. J22R133]|uniref:class I SAM-dependent methyltransferase n=1 Tax=Variovorax brevis TaxID=3053503 RepID=UPI0025785AA0|nr:class I SAM-dependent methyltransferase [Variovorax sp. J22R133]MDM0114693.1 class I SAM-dependent methyltransferase [Variovorax sp. J22R133]